MLPLLRASRLSTIHERRHCRGQVMIEVMLAVFGWVFLLVITVSIWRWFTGLIVTHDHAYHDAEVDVGQILGIGDLPGGVPVRIAAGHWDGGPGAAMTATRNVYQNERPKLEMPFLPSEKDSQGPRREP